MIYLFNQTEELIDVIDEASLADFTHTIELNQFDRASFEIPVDYKPNIIKEAQFFGFQSRDRAFCLFRISEKSYDIGLTIQGIDRAESDLHSFIIEDKRPGGNASDVLREILKGTGYQLGNVDGLTINGNMSFYFISVRQALVKLIESYACEFKIRYTFVENKIIGRYIDLNQRFGRKTGHQFEYGSNILNITYEESSDEVVTALIGRGKGEQSTDESGEATGGYGRRIQFKDVVWSVSKGDPVDKPAGQNYVANETARNIYGLHQNGEIKHRFGVYTNEDIEDPVELLKATYKELQRLSVPLVTFKANLLDLANAIEQDVWIGDSVGIVRDQIGIAFEARIHKLTIDKLDDNRSVVELGDYQTLQAKDRSTRQQAIKDAVSGFSEGLIEEAVANEVDRRNKEFDEKIRVNKLEFDNELQRAKERAEEIKRQISSEIDKKFQSFDNASIQEARRKAEEALRSAGASSSLAQEAKQISERARTDITNLQASSQNALSQIEAFKTQYGTKLNEVKNTADGLFTKMGAVETYINKDGQRQESLQRYARDESARQVSAVREQISRDYVGKATYQEDVRGLERRFSAIRTQTNNDIATKIAQYKQTVDGQFASITSQIAGKANQTDFQHVRETSQLYERIIGSSENDISNKVARMALTNQLFQVEVAKASAGGRNLFLNSLFKRSLRERYSTYLLDDSKEQTQGQLALSIDTNTKFRGANTLKIVSTFNGNPNNQKVTFRTGGDMRLNTADEMRNKSVRFSFWAKSTVNNTNFQARAGYRNAVEGVSLTTDWKFYDIQLTKSENSNASNEVIMHVFTVATVWIAFPKVEIGTVSTPFSEAPEDTDEAIRTVQSQLAGSWAVQNINSAGDIISGINLGANGHNRITGKLTHITGETLIDRAVIKSAMVDKLKTANFEAGSVTTVVLDAEAVTADKVRMDQAFANKLVASNIFTDTLAAKQAFINKLRSVVVTATLLEGYKGRIGGFQIGTHDKDPSTYWLTGQNQFAVGMSNGSGNWGQTALWVNWGNNWGSPSDTAWFVKHTGQMFCYNRAEFWNTPLIHGDLQVTGDIFYNNKNSGKSGYWIHSSKYSNFEPSNNYLYLYYSGSGYDWIPMNKEISDRRYKNNIEDSTVSGLDIVNSLKTYSYRKEYDGKIEDIACGIMAQDVQKYIPEAFYENPDGAYSYRTFELVPYLIKAIQELNQKMEEIA
jgi:phage minor structural protein